MFVASAGCDFLAAQTPRRPRALESRSSAREGKNFPAEYLPPFMPELPDVQAYLAALERNLAGRVLERIRLRSPFLVRSVDPPLSAVEGRRVRGFARLGKRIVMRLGPRVEDAADPGERASATDDLALVLHLMIAGRLRWHPAAGMDRAAKPASAGRIELAAFELENGTLLLTEAGTKKRASLHVVRGEAGLAAHGRGGLDVLAADLEAFRERLLSANHTVKRALCDPELFSGIGSAYSDEILHRARLSPLVWTSRLAPQEIERLHASVQSTLRDWTERIARDCDEHGFPRKVTAFREGMAVHGRYRQPCPDCGSPVQRIVHAENETNYCARCQTGGKLLRDRALSQLLKDDWPCSLDEL
jgi:formamidopyrimidine-DNA glycosylase